MTNEERDIITRFIERAAGSGGGSVPTSGAPLPPVDAEADALIAELYSRHPEARYRITQMAFVQEHALAEAQNRINQLQYQLASARQAAAGPPTSRGGFFSGLFGGGAAQPWNAGPAGQAPAGQVPAAPPPPQPTYAPGYQPGMFQRGGSGFLGSALTTAAGVAGGVVMGNALMSLFSPHAAMGGNFAGPSQETIVNQTIYDAPSPWTDPGAAAAGSNPGPDPWGSGQAGQNFDPSQGGFDPSPGGIGGGFDPSQGGFDPTQAGFDPSQGGFDPGQDSFDPGSFDGDDDTNV